MAVLRISKKQQNFVILDKTCLTDPTISWGAKGLHAYLMSMPDNWQVKVSNLQKSSRNGRDAVRGFLNELEDANFIKKSVNRDLGTGQFGGVEYLVFEIPCLKENNNTPITEMPLVGSVTEKLPETENPLTVAPAPGNPLPEKPTLINNKYNNKLLTKITTAAEQGSEKKPWGETKAAAVKKITHAKNTVVALSRFQSKRPQSNSASDLTIGSELTEHQSQSISHMVSDLSNHGHIQDIERYFDEITFVLLDLNQFKACGKDFNYKLNAIRLVIQRGDWRTPVWMQETREEKKETLLTMLSAQLSKSHADLRHFKGLHAVSHGELKQMYEEIMEKSTNEIKKIEREIEEQKSEADVAM